MALNFTLSLPFAPRVAGGKPRARRSLLARYGEWLRRLDDAQRLREADPRLAQDIGAALGCDRPPEGFAADPRPLWGIGLTPGPTEVPPAWFGRRGD